MTLSDGTAYVLRKRAGFGQRYYHDITWVSPGQNSISPRDSENWQFYKRGYYIWKKCNSSTSFMMIRKLQNDYWTKKKHKKRTIIHKEVTLSQTKKTFISVFRCVFSLFGWKRDFICEMMTTSRTLSWPNTLKEHYPKKRKTFWWKWTKKNVAAHWFDSFYSTRNGPK